MYGCEEGSKAFTEEGEIGANRGPPCSSLQYINQTELYPKQRVIIEDKELVVPFVPLCGEYVAYLGRTAHGTLALSNYRLYHQITDANNTFYNLPLGMIESVEQKDIIHLQISCKDARLYRVYKLSGTMSKYVFVNRLTFSTNEVCLEWTRRLVKATSPAKSVEEVFAFALYAWANEEGSDEILSRLSKEPPNAASENFKNEVERLQFDVSGGGPWRISRANSDYRLCSSYPKHLLIPACISDQGLDAAAKFRSARRVPAVVWRHRMNGAVIARCSQPEVGWLGWRSSEDEELLKAIADACTRNSSVVTKRPKKLLIMDARSYTTAVANRARGGGCECPEYYPNCDIQFMNLANIHAIRKSFSALRNICCPTVDLPNWYSLLEGTRWLQNMSGLLHAAITAASTVENDARPVLVHCSDGWDRTPEIVSLAQLLLDPYYRTVEGFQTLVEKEWLEFGHKFADRCGQSDDSNERCPVFLQWLDCVHNLVKQFPCAFQLNGNYLVKLAQHTYSNMFGTFLCNNSRQRTELNVSARTFSVWSFLQSPQYLNHLYSSQEQVLWPSCNIRDLELWRELYLGTSSASDKHPSPQGDMFLLSHQDSNANVEAEFMNGEDLNGNGEEQNNHIEEFEFRKGEGYKCEDEEDEDDQNQTPATEILSSTWNNSSFPVVFTTPEDQKLDEDVVDGVEACWKTTIASELASSAQSSTETLTPANGLSESPQHSENTIQDSSSVGIQGTGRPVPVLLDPVDGLTPLKDDIQQRLTQMCLEHKAKEIAWERELHTTRLALLQQVCHQCTHPSPPERPDDDGSVCSTEVSWEAVEEQETMPTLWMPDHAVSHCQGCHNQFWLGRRKHHCRGCGKIFCADCSENAVALPEEQLYEPVRVCAKCFNNPPTTCKQAAGQESQPLVTPAHTHA